MWLFTTFGFFSIVQKTEGDLLTVRARFRVDLDRLRDRYLPALSPTEDHTGTDYPYRARARRADLAEAVRQVTAGIDYSNFKDAVGQQLGGTREELYMGVWEILQEAEDVEAEDLRYGGVVLNERGEVLLFEPAGHFGGYVWTFPKGTPEPGETPEQTAVREVREETGVPAEVIGRLPRAYPGTTSTTVYFLMKAKGQPGARDGEARAVKWVALEGAAKLINKTKTAVGRRRDLEVLADASALLAGRRLED